MGDSLGSQTIDMWGVRILYQASLLVAFPALCLKVAWVRNCLSKCLYVSMQRRKYEITTNIYHFSAARWANAVVEGVTIHTRALLRKQEGKT